MAARESELHVHATWALVCLAMGTAGCIVNESRCDVNQVRLEGNDGLCACVENAVPSARGYGCDLCSDTELARGDRCECKPGFERGASGACERSATSTFRQPCSAAEPCTEPYPLCANVAGDQFCTKPGCTTNADCPTDYVCRSEGDVRFCGPLTGLGKKCETTGECAGTEAVYCETLQAKVCLSQGCTSTSACPSGWSCCDLARFIQTSLCVPTSYLDDGKCIDGSMPVSP
ncbi:MAG: hypothetical protein ABW252_23580 [Polyangiales bacterium]